MSSSPFASLVRTVDKVDAFIASHIKELSTIVCIAVAAQISLKNILHGNLRDPDDYLYLTQAIDWLNTQSWFDLIQHRLNPPEGTYIHFSRILSAFYGCLIFILQPVLGQINAALTVAAIVPLIYLVLYIAAMFWAAAVLMDKKWLGLTNYVILFSSNLLFQFSCGHIDHHGLEILLATVVFGCLARVALQPEKRMWPILAGIVLAFGVVVGLEILPVMIVFAGWVGLRAIFRGGRAARNGALFGGALALASLFFLVVTQPAYMFFRFDVQIYSIVYVILACNIALCLIAVAGADRSPKTWVRYVIGFALPLVSGIFFLCFFPQLTGGPWGGTDPAIKKLLFESATEAWPLIAFKGLGIAFVIWPLMALITSGVFFIRTKEDQSLRWIWGLLTLLLAVCIPLSFFYQCRFLTYVETFSVIPLSYIIWKDWTGLTNLRLRMNLVIVARLAFFILAGPLASHLSTNADHQILDEGQRESATGEEAQEKSCNMQVLAKTLNDPRSYGDHPRIIINSMSEGMEILFRTPHMVLSAPYHMDHNGNLDALQFFTTRDPNEAHSIAQRHHADLVVFCNLPHHIAPYIENDDHHLESSGFIQQLINGQIPNWLKPIQRPSFENLMLFEVHS